MHMRIIILIGQKFCHSLPQCFLPEYDRFFFFQYRLFVHIIISHQNYECPSKQFQALSGIIINYIIIEVSNKHYQASICTEIA